MTKALTPAEVAERLQVSEKTVRALIRSGTLVGFDASRNPGTGNPRYRVSESELEKYMDRQSLKPTGQPKRAQSKRRKPIEFFPRNGG